MLIKKQISKSIRQPAGIGGSTLSLQTEVEHSARRGTDRRGTVAESLSVVSVADHKKRVLWRRESFIVVLLICLLM